MMGPAFTFRDDEHLHRLMEAVRESNVEVLRDESSRVDALILRRGRGLVRASCWRTEFPVPEMHFSFGHPFNPFLWSADRSVLREVMQILLANGSSRVDPEMPA